MKRDRLLLAARPDLVLLPSEADRVDDFVQLFQEQLLRKTGGAPPTITQIVAARTIAVAVWQADRQNNLGADILMWVEHAGSPMEKTRNEAGILETSNRMRGVALNTIRQADALLELAGDRAKVSAKQPSGNRAPVKS